MTANEAHWHIFEFPFFKQSDVVHKLTVHLPMEQPVIVETGREEDAINLAEYKKFILMAWFDLNIHDLTAKQFHYGQIPEHCTWDRKKCEWHKGKNFIIFLLVFIPFPLPNLKTTISGCAYFTYAVRLVSKISEPLTVKFAQH